MPKSTIYFAILSIALAASTAFVTWLLWQEKESNHVGAEEGVPLALAVSEGTTQAGESTITAKSALLYNTQDNSIEFEHNAFERRPIASITKLMTAMVALDYGLDWNKEMNILPEENVIGSRLLMYPGEKVIVRDLFATSLVGSANNTTLAYVRSLDISEEEFVQQMNRKAIQLGLEQTEFVEVTGLDSDNVSTAYEVAKMAAYAFEHYPVIADISSSPGYDIDFIGSDRTHTVKNSNKILSEWGDELTGSKTGYLYEAAYCIVARGVGPAAHRISVILGSPSEIAHFVDTKTLLNLPGL